MSVIWEQCRWFGSNVGGLGSNGGGLGSNVSGLRSKDEE